METTKRLLSERTRGSLAAFGWFLSVGTTFMTSAHPFMAALVMFAGIVWVLIFFGPEITRLRVVTNDTELEQFKYPYWLISVSISLLLSVGFVALIFYASIMHQPVGLTDNEFARPYLKGYNLRLEDLADAAQVIHDRTFEDCWIYGPAIVVGYSDNFFRHPTFLAKTFESLFLIVPDHTELTGAILLRNCTFINCHFMGVQFIGSANQIGEMRRTFKINSNPWSRLIP